MRLQRTLIRLAAAGLLVTGCGSDDGSGGDDKKAENAESAENAAS